MTGKSNSPEGSSTASGGTRGTGDKEEFASSLPLASSVVEDANAVAPRIRSQAEMCDHFIPILLEQGSIVHKMGKRMARAARRGEHIKTIINGEICGETIVEDDTSFVIRQESADHELYTLDAKKFALNFSTTGMDITETEPRFEELRHRGFRYYERKGQALMYQVTEEDMKFVPGGFFEVAFSRTPQPLRAGDYLVAGYPRPAEVYMSRHNTIYKDGQVCHGPGVVSQDKMREHFLPIMRSEGTWFRRAGMRLARPARKGEEVCTIVNGEVVSKVVVSDDTSMIIQEESADREIYCLAVNCFAESYEPEGKEITEQGGEFDTLRARGYKYYQKTGGMVLMYRVTEEDMEFVPSGSFQVPFSHIPYPLRVGDSLITRDDLMQSVIYASRNAEQVYYSQKNLEVHYVFASPLGHPALSFTKELDGLRTSGAIVRLTCATSQNLRLLKKAWGSLSHSVLHVACHACVMPSSEVAVLLEDEAGQANPVPAASFTELVIGKHLAPQVVVLNCCNSQALADAFLEQGVQRVVSVRVNQALLDRAAHDFTLSFYGELRANRSVEAAFTYAVNAMRTSRDQALAAEADKFMLLPEDSNEFYLGDKRVTRTFSNFHGVLEPHIAVRVPFGVGEAGCIGPLIQPNVPMVVPGHVPLSRSHFIKSCLSVLTKFRVLKIHAPPGSGKKAVAGMLAKFAAFPGGRIFSGGAVLINATSHRIPSQDEMRRHFLPILSSKGTLVQKVGKLACRKAKMGEEVLTVVNGEVVARTQVDKDDSMVVLHDSADHELYVHTREKFSKNYVTPGTEITEEGPEFDTLRERGFKYYERKGMVLLYKVSAEDMEFFPEGKFVASFSETPIPIKVGDHIATSFPNQGTGEVYLSRNAEHVYLSKVVRTNKEMYQHFSPIMAKQGTIARRVGVWMARPGIPGESIQTVIGNKVLGISKVSDNRSMVVLADSADGEQYALSERQFSRGYKQPGMEITKQGPLFDSLRAQGFRNYERHGMVRIYQVTEADLEFVPAGKFWGNVSTTPQDVKIGDYLVTAYPASGDMYVSQNAEQVFAPVPLSDVVRSSEDMRCHFIPILERKGTRMRRTSRVAARKAERGETIRTIIDGEMVAKAVVDDDQSMVVRMDTSDREMYVLNHKTFKKLHDVVSIEITEEGLQFDALRDRGFKWYNQRGMVVVHQVTAEDFEFVPGGMFLVSFSLCPQPLKVGDYLAAEYPEAREVYLSRNALQIYSLASGETTPPGSAAPFREDLPAAGSPALWLKLERRHSGRESPLADAEMCFSRSLTRDGGLGAMSVLQDALLAAISKQAALAQRWFEGPEVPPEGSLDIAMASWLKALPSGSRALLVLVGGEEFLTFDATREMLRKLLRNYPNLHLVVTLTDKNAAGSALDPEIVEHPWPVELPAFQPREAAEVFYAALLRHHGGRQVVAAMTPEQAISRLEQHAAVQKCHGKPRDILDRIERISESAATFDDL